VGNDFSQAIEIEAHPASAVAARTQPIQVEVEVSAESVRVAEQLLLTVRLIAAPNISNLAGDSLAMEGADGQLLDQRQFTEWQDGSAWQVVEWTYALFPRTPGTLNIPAQSFSGVSGAARSLLDPWNSAQRVLGRSEIREIEVLPAAEREGQPWFPANGVRIEAEWRGEGSSIRVGEPITRTISIIADGQRPEVIPALALRDDENFRIYPDQPELIRQTRSDNLVGIRRQSMAMIPHREGELMLPELRVPWWDAANQTWREARLPAERIQVLPAAPNSSLAPPEIPAIAMRSLDEPAEGGSPLNPWMISTLVLALACLYLAWRRPRTTASAGALETGREPAEQLTEQRLWQRLCGALQRCDYPALRQLISQWLELPALASGPRQVGDLLDQIPESARLQWRALERRHLTGAGDPPADLSEFRAALEKIRDSRLQRTRRKPPDLAPLYPGNS
jgi:hypothetical protein